MVHRNNIKETRFFFHREKADKLTATYLSLAIPPLLLQYRETKLVKKAAKISVPLGANFPNLRTSEISQQLRGIFSNISLPADFCRRCLVTRIGTHPAVEASRLGFHASFVMTSLGNSQLFSCPWNQKSICAWYTSCFAPKPKGEPTSNHLMKNLEMIQG